MEITWTTEKRKVNDLIPHPNNPRQISKKDFDHLMMSIIKYDYVELVAINKDNTILAGHMRIKALKELKRGHDMIEVRVPNRHLTEKEANEYLIRSNKNTGDWDYDILGDRFDIEDLCAFGFSPEEMEIELKEKPEKKETEICDKCGQKIKKIRK